jgi:hypothetical protein
VDENVTQRWYLPPVGRNAFAQYVAIVGAIVAVLAWVRIIHRLDVVELLFAAWSLLPFSIAYRAVQKHPDSRGRALAVGLASLFGLVAYLPVLLSPSARAGFTFLFVPVFQLLVCGVTVLVTRRAAAKAQAQ